MSCRWRWLGLLAVGSRIGAQTAAEAIAAGDRDYAALNATSALKHYQEALALDSTNYDALCKAAYESVSLGEFDPSPDARAALYKSGQEYARRAVAANPKGADGHFQLARAVGRMALTMGMMDQVKYGGTEVYNDAMAALAIAPKHAGALHVMGVWNEKIMQLNWASRTIAKTILGGHVMGEASWDNAQRYLEAGRCHRADTHHPPPRPWPRIRGPRRQGQGARPVRVDSSRTGNRLQRPQLQTPGRAGPQRPGLTAYAIRR